MACRRGPGRVRRTSPHLAGNALRHAPAAEVRRQGGDNEVGRAGGHRYQATVAAGGRIRGSLPLLKLVDGAHRRGHHRRRQREIRRRAGPVHPLDVRRVLQGVEEAVDPHDAPELRLVLGPRPRHGVARQLPGAGRVALAGGSVDDELVGADAHVEEACRRRRRVVWLAGLGLRHRQCRGCRPGAGASTDLLLNLRLEPGELRCAGHRRRGR